MSKKQFSMQKYWDDLAANHKPEMTFEGKSKSDFELWYDKAYEKYCELLGMGKIKKVPLEAEIEDTFEKDGLIYERVVFDCDDNMSVPCYVIRPKDMKRNKKNAAIVCSHGHGPWGKFPVAGITDYPGTDKQAIIENIKRCNYNYGEQMAHHGFMTICPDLRGFGERRDGLGPIKPFPGRDSCNINFLKGAMFGVYTLMLNIHDMGCCIDYLQSREEIDPERIGMMGLSQGGTMTCFTSAFDKRIKCADIICYGSPFKYFAIGNANWCGSQMVPEIYKYFDTFDIAGMIAPRPLLMEIGTRDSCFSYETVKTGFDNVKRIYTAAEAQKDLYSDIFDGEHSFGGNLAPEFFKKYL
ncbi:MAG: hypothetical protein E7588_00685 [Ruminococcaceae bacterium]|nr:hypothetical protein [Oscillospiraceae bacterium]